MKVALSLAKKGLNVSPNPRVGCVVVKDGKIVSRGYHEYFGGPHAEVNALRKAGKKARGATLYVNLEPCCHFGKTPPCTRAIIEAGVKEVVVGMVDPNQLVNGKGIRELKRHGIRVRVGIQEEECKKLNEAYIKYITEGLPFVVLKLAMSLDGKIATVKGDSMWISSETSRQFVKTLRGQFDGILVGTNTVVRDNPELLAGSGKNPIRIVLDRRLRIPLSSKVFSNRALTIVATEKGKAKKELERLERRGIKVLEIPKWRGSNEGLDLKCLMQELVRRGITSVLIEGGGKVAASALQMGLVDKVLFFIAPTIIGGEGAPTPVEGKGARQLAEALKLRNVTIRKLGEDILYEAYIERGLKCLPG